MTANNCLAVKSEIQMKLLPCSLILSGLIAVATAGVIRQSTSLLTFKKLSPRGFMSNETGSVSIDQQAYSSRLNSPMDNPANVTYDLAKKYVKLIGVIGIPDNWPNSSQGDYLISVDGQMAAKGTVSRGNSKRIDVDVEDGKSLYIQLRRCVFADPVLKGGSSSSSPGVSSGSDRQGVRLKEPEDGAKVSGTVELKWSSIGDAVSYGVEIISSSLDAEDDGSVDRFFAYSVKGGKTSLSLDTGRLAPGRYRWTVVAFGPSKMLGSFAAERYFTVQR